VDECKPLPTGGLPSPFPGVLFCAGAAAGLLTEEDGSTTGSTTSRGVSSSAAAATWRETRAADRRWRRSVGATATRAGMRMLLEVELVVFGARAETASTAGARATTLMLMMCVVWAFGWV